MIADVHGWLPTTLAFAALGAGIVVWFAAVALTCHLQMIVDPSDNPRDNDWMVIFLLIWPLVLPVLVGILTWRRIHER